MLASLMNERRISLNYEAADYSDAIREAGRLLEEDGCIRAEYTNACLETLRKMGAYMVLAKGLALPHARSTEGVLKTGISLVVLKNPVCFGNKTNDPVKVVFCLAAADNSEHLGALQDIAYFALDRQKFDALTSISDPADAFSYICSLS